MRVFIFALMCFGWVGCGQVRGVASTLHFERSCYSGLADEFVTVTVQAIDSDGKGVNGVPVRWRLVPDSDSLLLKDPASRTERAQIGALSVDGLAKITAIVKPAPVPAVEILIYSWVTTGDFPDAESRFLIRPGSDSPDC